MARQLKRHDRSDILIHWFNAACWLLLLITGIGLIDQPELNPLGQGYPDALRALVGGGATLLAIHEALGVLWILGFVLYLVVNGRGAVFFLREVFSVSPARDITWMLRKMTLMTVGPKPLKDPSLPHQGYYNMGQKAFAQASVVGGVLIAATGIVMMLSDRALDASATGLVGWAVAIHFIAVGLVFAGLLVHVYMAAISPDERPGLWSMFTGHVPEEYARHHHRLWFETIETGEEGD